jgi:hypothetical protein
MVIIKRNQTILPILAHLTLYYNELCSQNLAQEHKVLTPLLCSINQTTYKILAMITGENIYHIYTTRGISQDSRQNDSKLLLLNLLCL